MLTIVTILEWSQEISASLWDKKNKKFASYKSPTILNFRQDHSYFCICLQSTEMKELSAVPIVGVVSESGRYQLWSGVMCCLSPLWPSYIGASVSGLRATIQWTHSPNIGEKDNMKLEDDCRANKWEEFWQLFYEIITNKIYYFAIWSGEITIRLLLHLKKND